MNVRQLEGKLYLCCDILQDKTMGRKSNEDIADVSKNIIKNPQERV